VRIGIYLHVLQDTSSHATYCGDDGPTPPGGGDPGTYMYIANPELLPPNVEGGKNGQGQNADDLKAALVGTIVQGTAYSRAEVYKSGVVTLPLQQTNSLDRLHAMNAALAAYGDVARKRSASPAAFVPFEHMPGNSANPADTSVCWKPLPAKPAKTSSASR
jgi:hypothetical protein